MPNNFTTWLCLYFGFPLILWMAVFSFNRNKYGKLPKSGRSESLAFMVLAALMALLAWPVVIVVLIVDEYRLIPRLPLAPYWHAKHHLQRKTTIEAAELAAKVVDPLQRTPDLPFGHLNPGWMEFLQKKKAGFKLYAFADPGYPPDEPWESGPKWSAQRYRKLGYAWVKWGRIKAEFIYEWD